MLCLAAIACSKAIAPYTFIAFDQAAYTAYIVIPAQTDQSTWMNTSYYVLDSINMEMNRNKLQQGDSISIIAYSEKEAAIQKATTNIVGSYTYIYDTKEQKIKFTGQQ